MQLAKLLSDLHRVVSVHDDQSVHLAFAQVDVQKENGELLVFALLLTFRLLLLVFGGEFRGRVVSFLLLTRLFVDIVSFFVFFVINV